MKDLIGTIATTLTTISFFPQAIKVIKTKHTKDISLLTYAIFVTGLFFWMLYGHMLVIKPIIIGIIITLLPAVIILFMKIWEKP